MIIIVSRDKDFSAVVAEHAQAELGMPCRVVASAGEAKWKNVSLVVAEAEAGEWDAPVITVKNKPVRLQALLAEMRAALAKAGVDLGGGLVFSPAEKKLARAGKSVDLTDKEARLLHAIAAGGGAAKDALLKDIWGIGGPMDTHTLETHIYRLRGKLREVSGEDRIVAVEGRYKLTPSP